MSSLEEIQELIYNEIDKIEFNSSPGELYDPINYTLSHGGKRMRPALVLMGYDLFGDNIQEALKPAIGIELFHNFTLLHDDIMDNAPLRRNRPTVHDKWDTNTAILSGDAMFVIAYALISKSPEESLASVLNVFNNCALKVCEGQQLDLNFEDTWDVNIEQYIQMIEYKTAVLLASSLQIGSIIGGASGEDAKLMYECGKSLGIAFQLQDDLLDTYGDQEVFGKKVGGDITSNKKTFLLLKTLELCSAEDKDRLKQLMSSTEMSNVSKVEEVKLIYNKYGIRELCEAKMDEYFEKGMRVFDQVNVDESRKEVIRSVAEGLMVREV